MNQKKTTVREILEAVTGDICDHYCKWPEIYKSIRKDPDEALDLMFEQKCENCPLNRIGV